MVACEILNQNHYLLRIFIVSHLLINIFIIYSCNFLIISKFDFHKYISPDRLK